MSTVFARLACVTTFSLCTAAALAQPCSLLVHDNFRHGQRPHGGNGADRQAEMEDHLAGFWPLVTINGAQWITSSGNAPASWKFAIASPDPTEFDPQDENNGIAYGEASAAALVPFSMPTSACTISANVALFGSDIHIGWTSSNAVTNNFDRFGTLWITLTTQDLWFLRGPGGQVLASGTLPGAFGAGIIESGWYNLQISYDPITQQASAQIENLTVQPITIALTTPVTHVAFEAGATSQPFAGVGLNNFSVFTGPRVSTTAPALVQACVGSTVELHADVNTTASPVAMRWHKESVDGPLMMGEGIQPDGSYMFGIDTDTLVITNAVAENAGVYRLYVGNSCGMGLGASTVLDMTCPSLCDSIDFNADTLFPDDADLVDFLSVLAGGECSTNTCNDIDFNNDGLFPDDNDLVSFLRVLAGGSC